MAHSLVMAGKICPVRQDENQSERNLRRSCSCPTCTIRDGKRFTIAEADRFIVVAVLANYT
jgi:hypothetical protein